MDEAHIKAIFRDCYNYLVAHHDDKKAWDSMPFYLTHLCSKYNDFKAHEILLCEDLMVAIANYLERKSANASKK